VIQINPRELVELTRPPRSRSLGTASKLNRDPAFIRELIAHGEARAEESLAALAFEQAWRRRDPAAALACFAADAELVSSPPFPDRGACAAGARSAASSAST
jgi:NTE family protein